MGLWCRNHEAASLSSGFHYEGHLLPIHLWKFAHRGYLWNKNNCSWILFFKGNMIENENYKYNLSLSFLKLVNNIVNLHLNKNVEINNSTYWMTWKQIISSFLNCQLVSALCDVLTIQQLQHSQHRAAPDCRPIHLSPLVSHWRLALWLRPKGISTQGTFQQQTQPATTASCFSEWTTMSFQQCVCVRLYCICVWVRSNTTGK